MASLAIIRTSRIRGDEDHEMEIVQNQALNVGSELLKPVLPITILYSSFIALKIYHEYHYAQMNIKSIHYQNKLTKLYIYVGI